MERTTSLLRRNCESDFEKIKITKSSTNRAACNLYYDSFAIEKVKIQTFDYDSKLSVDAYLDFEEVIRIAKDCMSGKILKDINQAATENKQYNLGYKGSKSSPNYDGKPESRQITFGLSKDKIYVNMVRCEGIRDPENGTIKPKLDRDKTKDVKISVGMSIDKFRSMFMYAEAWINAFLIREVPLLYDEAAAKRKEANSTQNAEN
jgi:hypothetical protein